MHDWEIFIISNIKKIKKEKIKILLQTNFILNFFSLKKEKPENVENQNLRTKIIQF